MLRVGLTGGIGAGKSTVAHRLAELGAVVIDADLLAREVVAPGSQGLAAVVEAFGPRVLAADGGLDRPALGRVVFADDAARRRLNAITHPLIARRTGELMAAAPADAVVVHDVPLLVENRMGGRYHLVAVVHAALEQRIERLVQSRGMTPDDARARVAAQARDDERRAAADVWLDNSGAPDGVLEQVDRLWERRLLPFEQNVRLHRAAARPAQVTVVDPDPRWPAQARRLVDRVAVAVGPAAARVDHVGSTAVPGLAAKDLVDLQLVLADLATADAVRPALEDAGFVRLDGPWWDDAAGGSPGGAPDRLPKRVHVACDPQRAVNLHVRVADGPAWRWQLLFRDWLQAHPEERDAYAGVKRGAAGVGIEAYLDRKGPWVEAALARARLWAERTGWAPGAPEAGTAATPAPEPPAGG